VSAAEPRRLRIRGLHHVTLICKDLGRTTAFYRDLLGLGLLAEATNDDDPGTRHFFFGDADGSPGTLVTCLEYPRMEQGRVGTGSTHHIALLVDTAEELEGWREYLRSRSVACTDVLDRTYFRSIYLRDPDGHIVELATRGPGLGATTPQHDETAPGA
jgi:glyoxylase I family protein